MPSHSPAGRASGLAARRRQFAQLHFCYRSPISGTAISRCGNSLRQRLPGPWFRAIRLPSSVSARAARDFAVASSVLALFSAVVPRRSWPDPTSVTCNGRRRRCAGVCGATAADREGGVGAGRCGVAGAISGGAARVCRRLRTRRASWRLPARRFRLRRPPALFIGVPSR